ncbi:MAG TPA: glutathione S-transferase family protein [Geminicoccaceae bacterium]|nr:glutathione S-transferase family protein [Geminicoccaceae bacterium]
MAKPVIYGPGYSTFARTVRLALEEKGADYDLVEVDLLSGAGQSAEHLARHPFGKVPAFEHDGFALYETDAIVRYVDESFPGTDLVPADARSRARMNQAMSVLASYAYPCLIGQIFMQRAVMPMIGNASDEAAIAAALPNAETALGALEQLIDRNRYLAGERLSLADLLLIPIYDYVRQTPEGEKLLQATPNLRRWWDEVRTRPSVEKTRPALG